jgi:hypothetical protein
MYNQNKHEFHRRLAVLGGISGLGGKTDAEGKVHMNIFIFNMY